MLKYLSLARMAANKITIAIDGFSSCGKSTLAKELAKELNYVFIDSGAMYRGVTLYAFRKEFISETSFDAEKVISSLDDIQLHFELNPITKIPELFINNENVEGKIRSPKIARLVSRIAELKEVREKLVKEQRKMGEKGGIVMDGRDIGSVVFPSAEIKFFVTADISVRVDRRYKELLSKGFESTHEEVKINLLERDRIDSTRAESPLIQPEDAIVIDNSNLSREEQLEIALKIVHQRIQFGENFPPL